MVAQHKWDKVKAQIEEIFSLIHADPKSDLVRKQLEQVQGF
jgi:hypothetical protein